VTNIDVRQTHRPIPEGVQKNDLMEKSVCGSGGYKNDDYEVEID
jgi:hypothetical protein